MKRKKGYEKIFEEVIVENFPTWKRKQSISPRGAKNSIQGKPKEKNDKTHTNQTSKD